MNRSRSVQMIASCLELIFIKMFRLVEKDRLQPAGPGEKIVGQFQNLLETRLSELRLVKEYAAQLHVSPKHLNRITKKITGKTASQMIADALVLEAKRQLLYSGQNVSEVGYELGFQSPSHFIKYFKTHAGTTPNQYRREKMPDRPLSA